MHSGEALLDGNSFVGPYIFPIAYNARGAALSSQALKISRVAIDEMLACFAYFACKAYFVGDGAGTLDFGRWSASGSSFRAEIDKSRRSVDSPHRGERRMMENQKH